VLADAVLHHTQFRVVAALPMDDELDARVGAIP
jgi:hypothetical protein